MAGWGYSGIDIVRKNLLEDHKKEFFSSKSIYRNIPTNHPKRHLYGDDLSEDELDLVHFWADYGSGIPQENPFKDRWYDYQDPEDLSFVLKANLSQTPDIQMVHFLFGMERLNRKCLRGLRLSII